MTALIKRRRIEPDRWLRLPAEAQDAPREGEVIVPLALWRARGEVIRWCHCSLGVWLEGHDDPAAIAKDLHVFELIALRIGAFSDGRALSAARLLRGRYRWRGEVPGWQVRREFARSHVMVISSVMEGGANVVSEAIVAGVPVIASKIDGNVGLLGADYRGYYPAQDTAALAALLFVARPARATIDYAVSVAHPERHGFNVTMRMKPSQPKCYLTAPGSRRSPSKNRWRGTSCGGLRNGRSYPLALT